MAAARRTPHKKVTNPVSPAYSPSSTRFGPRHPHLPDDLPPKRASTAQPQARPKPSSLLGYATGHRPRSRLSQQDDNDDDVATAYIDDEIWEQSEGPHITPSRMSKRGPDCKQYLAYTACAANKISRFPGPGSYNASLKPGGPSFSIGSRSSLRSAETTFSPGPGTYDVRVTNSGPSFSMGPKVRLPVTQQDLNPGPGTYSDFSSAFGRGASSGIRNRFK